MDTLFFATSNTEKIQIAEAISTKFGVKIKPVALDIDEIQGEDPDLIIRDKAQRAYEQLGMPVVVSDDIWSIRALNGFPGAYMKSINYWFKPEDFIRLMSGVKDRRITLHQNLAYTDGNITEIFVNDITGVIVTEPRGQSDKVPCMAVIELDIDNGKTIAEVFDQGFGAVTDRYKKHPDAWTKLLDWFSTKD